MARKARFGASLLSGRIPFDTEGVFGESGRSLFPSRSEEIRLSCTCAEEGLLCSHVLALLGVIGTRLGGDPLLLFELRGLERKDLLARLKEVRANSREKRRPSGRTAARSVSLEPLPKVRPDAFFKPTSPLSPRRPFFAPPEGGDLLPAWLGPVPFEDPQARALLLELHRAIGVGARERLSEWEWKKVHRKQGEE
jgi:uncharacterized Zn finger protein